MGYIIEPAGVDFTVAPSTLTAEDTAAISRAITDYKKTYKSAPQTANKTIKRVAVTKPSVLK